MNEALRHHTDHDARLIIERDAFPNNARIAREVLLPKRVTNDCHWIRAWLVIIGAEIASHQRSRAHHSEIVCRNEPGPEINWLVRSNHVHGPTAKDRYGFKDMIAFPPIQKVWIGDPAVRDFVARLGHPHQAIGFGIRQRP